MNESLLRVQDLCKAFAVGGSFLGGKKWLRAVDKVSLHVDRGETLGLVGESGSGKTDKPVSHGLHANRGQAFQEGRAPKRNECLGVGPLYAPEGDTAES